MKTLNDLIKLIDKKVENIDKSIVEAQNKTAQQTCNDIKVLAPGTGPYRESIKVYPTEIKDNVITTFIGSDVMVGPAKINGKFYNLGYLLEHGTLSHDIYPIDSEALRFMIDGEIIFAKHVKHPGTIAQPHYAIALEKNKKYYIDEVQYAWRDK